MTACFNSGFFYLLQVLEQCQYELVVPLTLLFSSTLLKVNESFIISGRTHTGFQRTRKYSYDSVSYLTWLAVPSLPPLGSAHGSRLRPASGGLPGVPWFPGLARALLLCQ